MRKYGFFFATLLLVCLSNRGNAQVQWQVLSPMKFIRGTGAPVTETFNFSAVGGTAIFKLTNGSLEDTSVEKVSSSVVTVNGQGTADSSNFNQNVDYIEKEIFFLDGQNTLEVRLMGKPGGQVTIQIVQEVAAITPQIARLQIANALRAGDIDLALEGFQPHEKREAILRATDSAQLNQLAHEIETAELVRETANLRFYRYSWTDETGDNFIKFIMERDAEGKWIITSW